jgi:SAM-dependent methyltransferase
MPSFDQDFWEQLWSQTLSERADVVARRPPNGYLTEEAANMRPGRALDAGCGHGAEAIWLSANGWQVTAVDFSSAALAHAHSTAEAAGAEVAEGIEWVEADLATWTPQSSSYDLVLCLYVHVAGSVEEMVQRMGEGVAAGGTLLMVGHLPIDPATGTPSPAAGQLQVSVESAVAALDPDRWELVIAENRPRRVAGSGVDAVIRARRLS